MTPDVAVAPGTGGAEVKAVSTGWANAMVFTPAVMLKVFVTGGAALKFALPVCAATIAHDPVELNVIRPAGVTVHTGVVVDV